MISIKYSTVATVATFLVLAVWIVVISASGIKDAILGALVGSLIGWVGATNLAIALEEEEKRNK